MERQKIINCEARNDGKTVYLYYIRVIGAYAAFGLSAYYADHVASPMLSYSDDFQMPVAILNRQNVLDLIHSMQVNEHESFIFYRLTAKEFIGTDGYENWVAQMGEIAFGNKGSRM